MDRLLPWVLRAGWMVIPFTAGPALAAALEPRSGPVQSTATVGLWAAWTGVVLATLVAHPLSLTAIRLGAPGAVVAALWAAATGDPGPVASVAAVATTSAVLLVALAPLTATHHVNGPAYPNERRFPLRAPAVVLAGGAPLAVTVALAGPTAPALLLASGRPVAGVVTAALGLPAAAVAARAVHALSRRWLVFVPAGLVIHDPMALADPVLFPREMVERLGPAPAGTGATDLTAGAPGLALELRLREPATIVVARRRRTALDGQQVDAVLVTPARPGAVMVEARTRRLAVGPP